MFILDVMNVAVYVAPMPGGVGPMTRAMLLKNVVGGMPINIRFLTFVSYIALQSGYFSAFWNSERRDRC